MSYLKFSPNEPAFIAWGAHAPSHVAVGAPAGRFFRLIYNSYWSMPTRLQRKARIRAYSAPFASRGS